MKSETIIYRDLLTAYKALAATYNTDGSPNRAVWRMVKRTIFNAINTLGQSQACELQGRAMIKSGINTPDDAPYSELDWDNVDNGDLTPSYDT